MRVEIFIIDKNSGSNLHKYSILGAEDEEKDELFSNFFTALNKISKEIGMETINLIRFGMGNEARFYSGIYIFTVFILEFAYNIPIEGSMVDQVLRGLAKEITDTFEKQYKNELEEARKHNINNTKIFMDFRNTIDKIINRAGNEAFLLYQKSILMEAIKLDQGDYWITPLLKRLNKGENIMDEFDNLIKSHSGFEKAIKVINYRHSAIWEIFAVPIYPI